MSTSERPPSKSDFLREPSVIQFIPWIQALVSGEKKFQHQYLHRKLNRELRFDSLEAAARSYYFSVTQNLRITLGIPNPSKDDFEGNQSVLNCLRMKIRTALDNNDSSALEVAAAQILQWGGVQRGNTEHILRISQNCTGGLHQYLSATQQLIDNPAFERPDYQRISVDRESSLSGFFRSNAGFTKIYHLCFDSFVIYDSRVAAAIALMALRFSKEYNFNEIPYPLRFCTPPRRATVNRDPSSGKYSFPASNGRDQSHFASNLRCNWILSSALGVNSQHRDQRMRFMHEDPQLDLRYLEAALFMIGYEVSGS